jgi:hypothetical protein
MKKKSNIVERRGMIRTTGGPESVGHIAARISRRVEKLSDRAGPVSSAVSLAPTSRQKLERWLTYETQAKAMALASDLDWTVDRILTAAIGLFTMHVRHQKSRDAARKAEAP